MENRFNFNNLSTTKACHSLGKVKISRRVLPAIWRHAQRKKVLLNGCISRQMPGFRLASAAKLPVRPF
jgi:hypothetical protein